MLTQDDSEFTGKDGGGATESVDGRDRSGAVLGLKTVIEVIAVLRDLVVSLFMSDALYVIRLVLCLAGVLLVQRGRCVFQSLTVSVFFWSRSSYRYCFERPVLELRKSLCELLKQLHGRDERISFCPPDLWLSVKAATIAQTAPLHTIDVDEFRTGDVAAAFPKAGKLIEILKTLPFVLPFDLRAKLFQSLVQHDRQGREPHGGGGMFHAGNVFVDIRRDKLCVDMFLIECP